MSAVIILVAYGLIGCGAAVAIVVQKRRVGGVAGAPAAVLMLILWPFLLPASMLGEPRVVVLGADGPCTARRRRIDELAQRLRDVLEVSETISVGPNGGRERALLDGFVARLRASDRRLVEMDRALVTAPPSIQSRLEALKGASARDLDSGVDVLEELVAQLTVLKFADLANPGAVRNERDHIEAILVRIEALADLAAADPPSAPRERAASVG